MGKDSKGRKTVTLPPQTPPTSFANLKAAAADAAEAISIAATQLHIFALSSSPQTATPLRYLTEPATWSALPEELRLRILSFVEVKDLCSLEAVCLETRRLANDDSLWCDLYLRRWRRSRQGDLISVPSDEHLRHFRFDWKDLYKKRFQLELSLWREDHEEHNLHDHQDHEHEQEQEQEDQLSGENDQDSSELRNSGEREGDGDGEEKDYEPFPPFKLTSDPEECFEWASRLSTRARQIVACRSRRRSYSVDSSSAECAENEYYTACPNLIERRRQHQEEVERERIEEVWSLWFISYEEFVTSQLLRESPRTRVAVNCFLAMLHLYYMSCECCKDVEGVKSSKATDKLFGLLQTRITQLMAQHPHWQDGYYAWGKLLSHQALRKQGQETMDLCESAWSKFQQALEIVKTNIEREFCKIEDSIHDPIHCSWGYTLLILGKRLLREKNPGYLGYFMSSKDQYMQANNRPKTDSCYVLRPYNLACLFSLLNDEVECRKYLEECVGLKGIDQIKVTDDADFANMKDKPWFHDMVLKFPEEELDS